VTASFLEVNRYVAEQALLEARRFRVAADIARARRVLAALDRRKGVKGWERLKSRRPEAF
jgi:hypothetical protein